MTPSLRAVAPLALALLTACGPAVPDGAREAVMDCQVVHDDPLTLTAVRVDGDTLSVDVSYGGGCKDHVIYACWDGEFLENDPAVFEPANPPRAQLALGHDARNDGCEAELDLTVDFSLQPLREAYAASHDNEADRLVLLLDGTSAQYPF